MDNIFFKRFFQAQSSTFTTSLQALTGPIQRCTLPFQLYLRRWGCAYSNYWRSSKKSKKLSSQILPLWWI